MSEEMRDDIEKLQRRVAALESLVINLIGAVDDIDEQVLQQRLSAPAQQMQGSLSRPLGVASKRFREGLIKVALR